MKNICTQIQDYLKKNIHLVIHNNNIVIMLEVNFLDQRHIQTYLLISKTNVKVHQVQFQEKITLKII